MQVLSLVLCLLHKLLASLHANVVRKEWVDYHRILLWLHCSCDIAIAHKAFADCLQSGPHRTFPVANLRNSLAICLMKCLQRMKSYYTNTSSSLRIIKLMYVQMEKLQVCYNFTNLHLLQHLTNLLQIHF